MALCPCPYDIGAAEAGRDRELRVPHSGFESESLPAGTTVELAAVGTGITVNAPTKFTIGCTTDPTPYSFSVSASATATNGSLTLTTTTKGAGGAGGVATTMTYPLSVTP